MREKFIAFLRSTEKYTKTDMVYFFRGNAWLNINRFLSIANGLVLSIAFAHLLTKEAYGTYTFVLALAGLFSMPLTTGLGAGIFKSVSRGNDSAVFEGLRRLRPWSVIGGGTLVVLGGYYFFVGNSVLAVAFALSGVLLPLSVSTGIAKAYLNSKGDFQMATVFNSWRTPLMTIILIGVAWYTSSALAIVTASLLGNVVLSFLLYQNVKRKYNLYAGKSTQAQGAFAGPYAFHSAVISIFGYLSDQIDDLLLWKFVGAAPVAVYTYAIAPVRELRALIENQSVIAGPKFAQKEFSEVRSNIFFRIKQLYIIVVPLAIAYIALAPYIFNILFRPYLESVVLSQIAALSLLSAPRRLMSAAISAHQRIKESYVVAVLPNVVRIVLAILLIPHWGINGAVAALLISEVVDYAILGVLMRVAR